MENFVQVKVFEGSEVRANEKAPFMVGALVTNNGEKTEVSGIVAGNPHGIHSFFAGVEAMAASVTKALLSADIPPQVIEAMMTKAVEDGINEAFVRHVEEEMPELHAMAERAKQGDAGALFEMLLGALR